MTLGAMTAVEEQNQGLPLYSGDDTCCQSTFPWTSVTKWQPATSGYASLQLCGTTGLAMTSLEQHCGGGRCIAVWYSSAHRVAIRKHTDIYISPLHHCLWVREAGAGGGRPGSLDYVRMDNRWIIAPVIA